MKIYIYLTINPLSHVNNASQPSWLRGGRDRFTPRGAKKVRTPNAFGQTSVNFCKPTFHSKPGATSSHSIDSDLSAPRR